MKYQPLRLVSWVNSTQCSFKPIKRLQMSNINGHHQPAGFGLVLKCHLRCIFWEQQIDTLEIYILVCLHYVSKSNPRNQGFLFGEKANGDSRSWLFLSRQYRSLWIPLNSYRIQWIQRKDTTSSTVNKNDSMHWFRHKGYILDTSLIQREDYSSSLNISKDMFWEIGWNMRFQAMIYWYVSLYILGSNYWRIWYKFMWIIALPSRPVESS